MIFIYNLLLPLAFLFFVPGLILKYRNRGGWKSTYGERFARFKSERLEELANFKGAIWIHSVSVGETMISLGFIKRYLERNPEQKFIISTTTTTGQELARNRCPKNTAVIFCPIDFKWMVKRTFNIIQPSQLVIFETELWPNLLNEAAKRGIPVSLVNGRMSDHSSKGYRRARLFFAPVLFLDFPDIFFLGACPADGLPINWSDTSTNAFLSGTVRAALGGATSATLCSE